MFVGFEDAEFPGGRRRIHLDGRDGDVRAGVDVLLEHLLVVHLVDVVAREDEDVIRLLAADRIDVLIDRVGRALIPVLRDAHLRRQHFDEIAVSHQRRPAAADVAVEAERFVLRENEDAAQVAVQAIRKRDVDDAIDAAERNRRLGAVARQRPEPLALAARQQNTDRVAHGRHGVRFPRDEFSRAHHSSSNVGRLHRCSRAANWPHRREKAENDLQSFRAAAYSLVINLALTCGVASDRRSWQ